MQVMHISAVSEIHNRLLPSLEMLRARPWRAHVCWQTLTQPAKRVPSILYAQMTREDAHVLLVPIKEGDVTQRARPKLGGVHRRAYRKPEEVSHSVLSTHVQSHEQSA